MPTILNFDEIRRLARETYEKASLEPLETRKKIVEDWFDEMLIDAYIAGFTGTGLPIDPVMDPEHVRNEVLNKKIGGKTYRDRVAEHVKNGNVGLLENLAESEAHRVSENGAHDTAQQAAQKLPRMSESEILRHVRERSDIWPEVGFPTKADDIRDRKKEPKWAVYAIWSTMRDDRVRDTHEYLEGMTQIYGRRFYTIDGDSARFPGDFSNAENNANCRCHLDYTVQRV